MALTINSSQSSSIANRSLQNISRAMDRTLAKLSSGSRVATARDDAASMAIGSRIRGELATYVAQKNNATQATSMLQMADGAYARVEDMMVRMRALATQAQSSNLSATERGMLDTEYQQIKREITRMAGSVNFSGNSLFGTSTLTFNNNSQSQQTDLSATTIGQYYNSAVGDMDGDGIVDLVSFSDDNQLRLFRGKGDGTFETTYTVMLDTGGVSTYYGTIQLADMNNDGRLDVIATETTADHVQVLVNNGSGVLTQYSTTTLPGDSSGTYSFAIGDFDGDGRKDLAFRTSSNNVGIYRNNGDGSFSVTTMVVGSGAINSITVGDVNNDGIDDVVASSSTRWVRAIYGSTSGSYSMATGTTIAGAFTMTANSTLADINNDGLLDFIVGDSFGNNIAISLNNGNGGWGAATFIAGTTSTGFTLRAGDFNGDGYTDIVYGVTGMRMLRGTGQGTFSTNVSIGVTVIAASVVDVNRDGRLDIVGLNSLGTGLISSLNTSAMGYNSSVRLGVDASTLNNITYRIGSAALNSLDKELGYSMITNIGTAKRATEAIMRGLDQLRLYRTSVGAAINRIEKAYQNIETMQENQESARSAYMDLDVASEMAQYTAQQLTMQAGISMLSQAGNSQRLIARLLETGVN